MCLQGQVWWRKKGVGRKGNPGGGCWRRMVWKLKAMQVGFGGNKAGFSALSPEGPEQRSVTPPYALKGFDHRLPEDPPKPKKASTC